MCLKHSTKYRLDEHAESGSLCVSVYLKIHNCMFVWLINIYVELKNKSTLNKQ